MDSINSNSYWNDRFEIDWESNKGPEQSRFFSRIAIDHSPTWLIDEIRKKKLTLADWGCAEGDGTAVWANYIDPSQITGIDFAEIAIKKAAQRYPAIHFLFEDWLNRSPEKKEVFDIVFSSNTLEHLHHPFGALNTLSSYAKKVVILIIPYQEHDRIQEHFSTFLPNNIPLVLNNGFKLVWSKVIACGTIPKTFWQGDQILLAYVEPNWFNCLNLVLKDCLIEHEDKEIQIAFLNQIIVEKDTQILNLKQIDKNNYEQITNLNNIISDHVEEIGNLNQVITEQNNKINEISSIEAKLITASTLIGNLNQVITEQNNKINEISSIEAKLIAASTLIRTMKLSHSWRLTAPLRFLARSLRYGLLASDRMWIESKLRYLFQKLPASPTVKLTIRNQYIQLFGRPLRNVGFKPFFEELRFNKEQISDRTELLNKQNDFLMPEHWPYKHKPYGILFLPIIDWHFRFQRPQQIARRFANKGHPVAYVSLTFGSKFSITPIENGIDAIQLPGQKSINVYQTVPSQHDIDRITNALLDYFSKNDHHWVCIVQLPYWTQIALELQKAGNFIVYDCLDHHAGFSTNEKQMLDEENLLIKRSDLVVTSSEFLFKKVQNLSPNLALIRNGVDYPHFAATPDIEHSSSSQLIIGYFGAIADWFDSTLVAEIALLRPSWQFSLIGSTFSADTTPFDTCPNIMLYGEKPYQELPKLITNWDCCIIPFKHLPLTEATNPVKVYEMLAAGKPIVSVTLPELISISNAGHIALADNALAFIEAIEAEVNSDNRYKQQARRQFALENTWEIRQTDFDLAIRKFYPLVSIIVVTYNNLQLNQICLESVLNDTDYPNYEVIVIDNASSDGTPQYLENLSHPKLTVILNTENRGYSRANNQGIASAQGKFICLLNNDTVVTGSWLSKLVRHLQKNPKIGIIGPVTNAIDNEAKVAVAYHNLIDMPSWSNEYCSRNTDLLEDISMLAFFCALIPTSVINEVGLLDEQFDIGMFEDDDYNQRVRSAGYQVKLAKDVYVHHWQCASFKLLGKEAYINVFNENKKKFQSKWAKLSLTTDETKKITNLISTSEKSPRTIIFAPSIGWNVHLFQRPHHLARILAQNGYTAIFDCSNSQEDVDLIKEIEPNLFLFKGQAELIHEVNNPILWTFTYNYAYRDHFPANTPVIYDWIDDLSVFPFDQVKLMDLHKRALQEATIIASVARNLYEETLKERPDAIYLPNAVEEGHFDNPPNPNPAIQDKIISKIISNTKAIAGYYGALANWFDYELLTEVAKLKPDWHFILIGPDYDGSINKSDIKRQKNITWLGPRHYKELPSYLQLFDVAMIPFKINEITMATSPLKLYEYFAGNKPVVTTPMPECKAFEEVCIAKNAAEFSLALDTAKELASDSNFLERLKARTAENTWQARINTVLSALSEETL